MINPSESARSVVPGQIEGFLAGCPICTARTKRVLDMGARFTILSGYGAGTSGTIIGEPDAYSSRPREHLAQMDDESPNIKRRLDTDITLVQILPAPPAPTWFPSIPIADAIPVDAALVDFCRKSCPVLRKCSIDWPAFYELIRIIWVSRLPIEPLELWAMLDAHGVPKNWKLRLTKFFSQGRELLVHVGGKRPIKTSERSA